MTCFALPILILLVCPVAASPQAALGDDAVARVKRLYDDGRWSDVVQDASGPDDASADVQMYRALALAKLERWDDSRRVLEAGASLYPLDARFPVELGGVAYRQSNFPLAKRELHRALRIEPQDEYANNLIGSIYFLEGNLEAALKYWNRANQPKLADPTFEPIPRVDPLILDRIVQFSPGSIWLRDRFLSSQARLDALGIYSGVFFDLSARPEGDYDLALRGRERTGLEAMKWESAASLLRGLPYLTVFPEFYGLGRSGLNWRSLIRWADQRRRLFSELSAPLESRPDIRYRLYFDGRNENWNLTNTITPFTPSLSGLNMERAAFGTEVQFIPDGRWKWRAGAEYSYRIFRSLVSIPASASAFFTSGSSLALRVGADRALVRCPERRFTVDSSASVELGTFFESPLGRFGRVEGSLAGRWFPKARGDDYALESTIKAGKTFGMVPFDELFTLGFERDNDLWMRGHPGLVDGQKGNAPLGRDYVLTNTEIDKIVYRSAMVSVKLGPFLDTGRVYDPSGFFGTRDWLWDTGLQAKVRLLGSVEFILGYGKDLRTGNNSFFTTVSR